MSALIMWLESHDNLAGWAQLFGAVLALAVTYFTAFAPVWRCKRRLRSVTRYLLSNDGGDPAELHSHSRDAGVRDAADQLSPCYTARESDISKASMA